MSKITLINLIYLSFFISLALSKETISESIEDTYKFDSIVMGGAGFVASIVTGKKEMYLRTDVGGAYKYDYEQKKWVQLFSFISEAKKGYLSVKGIAIDPTDENIVYFLCGCAYFSEAKTAIFKTTDGGKTFTEIEITDMIQVHGNGDGRQCTEPIGVDPDNHNTIYAGGDVTFGESALIKSTDGGKTWNYVLGYNKLGLYKYDVKYPSWTNRITRGTINGTYNKQNGVDALKIIGGKIYVATGVNGVPNVHVADVDKDEFTVLSTDLPYSDYPLSITDDGDGNLFFTYIASLNFGGSYGGAYKYNIKSGKVTQISPTKKAIGMITADKKNPKRLLARTCGVWQAQYYTETWDDKSMAWGDHFFRSTDGGESWINITPGQKWKEDDESYFVSRPLDTNGFEWIYAKAVHWGTSMVLDPRNPDKILMSSGNGVFNCDNVWDKKDVQFYFNPNGVEEVVAYDYFSVKGGNGYSAIADYDGFIHKDIKEIGYQYKPNIGFTSVIYACRQDPKVMIRYGNENALYSKDAGMTWTRFAKSGGKGGRGAIAKIDDVYRIFHSNDTIINYSDDFGETWTQSKGITGTKDIGLLVEDEDPEIIYAVTIQKGEDGKNKYILGVSHDGGKKFNTQEICNYDNSDYGNRIAYLEEGKIVISAGFSGAFISEDYGETVTKLESVYYCKTIGYGAPEKKGEVNTLFMYGKPLKDDIEGIYRSQDGGESWVLINSKNLYGGTGNGNFIVGDMNEFGMFYMSTVGCGIIYGQITE